MENELMAKKQILIDCDPGVDDALAIMLAVVSPELEVVGITTVGGNAPADVCASNAGKVLELCGMQHIPIHSGLNQPLLRSLLFDGKYSGMDGLNGTELPGSNCPVRDDAVDFIIDCARKHEALELISIAPMTNIATALQRAPDIRHRISQIVTTSGYYGLNKLPNVPRTGWNIKADPEAAKIVLESGIPVRALGLDVTAYLENAWVEKLEQNAANGSMWDFFSKAAAFNRERGLEPYSLLVDGFATAYVIDSGIAELTAGQVEVKVDEQIGADCTTLVNKGTLHNESEIYAAHSFSYEAYITLLLNRVFI